MSALLLAAAAAAAQPPTDFSFFSSSFGCYCLCSIPMFLSPRCPSFPPFAHFAATFLSLLFFSLPPHFFSLNSPLLFLSPPKFILPRVGPTTLSQPLNCSCNLTPVFLASSRCCCSPIVSSFTFSSSSSFSCSGWKIKNACLLLLLLFFFFFFSSFFSSSSSLSLFYPPTSSLPPLYQPEITAPRRSTFDQLGLFSATVESYVPACTCVHFLPCLPPRVFCHRGGCF